MVRWRSTRPGWVALRQGIRGSRQLKGRGAALVLVAVEKRGRATGRLRMAVIPDFKTTTINHFLTQNVAPGATIYTDGLKSFGGLEEVGFQVCPPHLPGPLPTRNWRGYTHAPAGRSPKRKNPKFSLTQNLEFSRRPTILAGTGRCVRSKKKFARARRNLLTFSAHRSGVSRADRSRTDFRFKYRLQQASKSSVCNKAHRT